MKKILAIMAFVMSSVPLYAAIATVRQVENSARPVYNSGTGVMPQGAQEAMPKTKRQIERNTLQGVGVTPIMASVVTPIQIPSADFDVAGLKINLFYGECVNFDGLDIGLVGLAKNHANGWMANVVANIAYGDGFGLNTALVNYCRGDFKGLQIGLSNWIEFGNVCQIGFFNGIGDGQGFQLGVVNTAGMYQGVQIGLVNIIGNANLKFLPLFNCYF